MSVSFSPDGTRIVTGSRTGRRRCGTRRTGTALLELKGHTGEVSSVSFSPDGTRIAHRQFGRDGDRSGTRGPARSCSTSKGTRGHRQSVSFSPDGTRIATGSEDKTAKVWDARTGTASARAQRAHERVWWRVVQPRRLTDRHRQWGRDGEGLGRADGHALARSQRAQGRGGECCRSAQTAPASSPAVWTRRRRSGTPAQARHFSNFKATRTVFEAWRSAQTASASSPAVTVRCTRRKSGTRGRVWPCWNSEGHEVLYPVGSVSFSPDGSRIVTGSGESRSAYDRWSGIALISRRKGNGGIMLLGPDIPDNLEDAAKLRDTQKAKVWDARTGQELKGEPIPPADPI